MLLEQLIVSRSVVLIEKTETCSPTITTVGLEIVHWGDLGAYLELEGEIPIPAYL